MAVADLEELMARAAWMYYDEELTQAQIAERMRMSRVGVTRLLQKARREGIVQIRIAKPLPLQDDLARQLQKWFDLRCAIVVKTQAQPEATLDAIGQAGAEHLARILVPHCRLGVGWSTTVSRMTPHLRAARRTVQCTVTELAGSLIGHTNPYAISWQVAQVFQASLETLPVPAIVRSKEARSAILKEAAVSAVLEHARQCDIAIVGLGGVGPDWTMVKTGYMTLKQVTDLNRRGAVGEILLHCYDAEGHHFPTPFESRTISIDWADIQRIPNIVVMASGATKIRPILGALRGRLCHCLITDTDTAQQVLSLI